MNDVFYNESNAPEKVMDILADANKHRDKLRIWYGNPETGKDYGEIHDIFGYIGRTTGTKKIPILLKRRDSSGGGAILTNNIVKITKDKKVIYQHPNFCLAEYVIKARKDDKYPFEVFADGKSVRLCKDFATAENEIAFHKGLRNVC